MTQISAPAAAPSPEHNACNKPDVTSPQCMQQSSAELQKLLISIVAAQVVSQ
jgi:hypothetical protein